jgi:hypothetical protein
MENSHKIIIFMALVIIYLVLTKCKECRKTKEEFREETGFGGRPANQPSSSFPIWAMVLIFFGVAILFFAGVYGYKKYKGQI